MIAVQFILLYVSVCNEIDDYTICWVCRRIRACLAARAICIRELSAFGSEINDTTRSQSRL